MSGDFVSLFCDLTQRFESPTNFWRWSAYGAIAATMRFNCYVNWGTSKLYPNLYILLLADSAAYRKDAGPELVEELLRECSHTKVISGRASYQGIVDELAIDIGNKKTGIPIKYGAAIVIALEFTAFFVDDPNLTKLLTEGYAFSEEFEYTLRGGKTKVKKRCLTILGGSNETLLRDFYDTKATYGGLLRRTCIIKPDKKRPGNPLMEDTDHLNEVDKKRLVAHLKDIQRLSGEFKFSQKAKDLYKDWYLKLYDSYDKIEDRSGFIQGSHSLIVKLAMILAAAKLSLVIDDKTVATAIDQILSLKENYSTYIMGSGKNPHANISAQLLSEMWTHCNNGNPTLKRRDILVRYWNEISAEDLDKLIRTLEEAGLITMIPSGTEPAWSLTQRAKDAFLKNAKLSNQKVN